MDGKSWYHISIKLHFYEFDTVIIQLLKYKNQNSLSSWVYLKKNCNKIPGKRDILEQKQKNNIFPIAQTVKSFNKANIIFFKNISTVFANLRKKEKRKIDDSSKKEV